MDKEGLKKEIDELGEFALEVRNWVGNSPIKGAAFGGACALVGYLLNIWPL